MKMKSILLGLVSMTAFACGGTGGGNNNDGGMRDASGCPDRDTDGLCDDDEVTHGTNPDVADSDNDGLNDGKEVEIGTNPLNPDTDGDGIPDGVEIELGTDPKVQDEGCASLELGATLSQKPVDIIMMVDNSGSMGEEIKGVQDQINADFAQILTDSGIDYRLILLSFYGDVANRNADDDVFCNDNMDPHECEICIGPPLAAPGTVCPPTALAHKPGESERFKHYNITINSRDSLNVIRDTFKTTDRGPHFPAVDNPATTPLNEATEHNEELTFDPWTGSWVALHPNGWGRQLRKGAQRVFLEVSDDDQNGGNYSGAQFKADLLDSGAGGLFESPPQLEGEPTFGTAETPNWVFHSIIGLKGKADPLAAYEPTEPIVTDIDENRCDPGGVRTGEVYQQLSIDSGGLRFPVCDPAGYDVVFNKIATRVVENAEIECEFPVPDAPEGESLDFARIFLIYFPGAGGTPQQIQKVSSAASCAAGKFYTVGGGENTVIHLCPQTCEPIQADNQAELKVNVACTEIIP
jgi:Bacterial TSP3 repeat